MLDKNDKSLSAESAMKLLSIADCVDLVSEVSGVSAAAICGPDRIRKVARARQLAMFLAWREGHHPDRIAWHIGRRDRTTALHGIARAEVAAKAGKLMEFARCEWNPPRDGDGKGGKD